jgi:single-strand DNA-binding protein
MAASVNKVIILGNLGGNPELRYTSNQSAVVTLSVATKDVRVGADGQRQEFTEWHRVVVWNKTAENCARYLTKGSSVFIEGRLQTRSWEDQNGQKRYTTEIIANNVQFLSGGAGQRIGTDQAEMPSDAGSYGGATYGGPASSAFGNSGMDLGGGFPQATPSSVGKTADSGPATSIMDDIPF